MALILAATGAIFIAAGVGLVCLPAGLVVAGVELVCAAYVTRYLEVRRATSGTARPSRR